MSLAKVTIVGNVGRDPETRYTPNGRMNVSFSVAVNRKWNDGGGNLQETVTWFRVTAWGRLAEQLDKLTQQGALTKGREVLVTGSIEQREWTAQDGTKRTNLEVTADDVRLIGGQREGNQPRPSTDTDLPEYDEVPF
jgi:single-strand DNA-binding protein